MRFSLALVSIVAGAAVQARPSPVSRELASTGAQSDKIVEARGLVDDLKDLRPSNSSSATTTSSSPASSSSAEASSVTSSTSTTASSPSATSSAASTSSAAAKPKSSVKPKFMAPAGVTTHDNDLVTTVHDAGTTSDRVGFRWQPIV